MSVSLVPEEARHSRGARRALTVVIAIHAILLLLMLRDYFADNDLGYHISLARQYAENLTYWWDHLNWAPTGRPNLQGPALHYAIAALGLLMGGEGWDYVRAFSILAVTQWAAAVFTAVFFARRFGGDRAALFAAALLTGNVSSAGPFFVGVPSGWIFILSAWAIHFFLEERYVLAALFGALTSYVHLGGAPVIAVGIVLAAVATRRWKGLALTGGLTVVLASPYVVHFLSHLDWYTGRRGHVAGTGATFTYVLAAPGLIWLLFRRRKGLFLLLWAVAPLAWLFQDALRFFLQSAVAASAIAGVFLAWLLYRFTSHEAQHWLTGTIVLIATLFPFSIPSLPVEAAWAAGQGFPRELDWHEAEALAMAVREAELQDRIFFPYYDSMNGAMSVFEPVSQRWGHWGEVRPREDPAYMISTGAYAFMLPLPPGDSLLVELEALGLATDHGGGRETTIVTLPRPGDVDVVIALLDGVVEAEVEWLVRNAVPNLFPPPAMLFDVIEMRERRARMAAQKIPAGRIELAVVLYAYAIEDEQPDVAAGVRGAARGWGSVANFIGDETALDYVGEERFERFRSNLAEWGETVGTLRETRLPSPELDEVSNRLFDEFF